MKRVKQTINALCSFERANLEDEDFNKNMEDYCIATNTGFFWGFRRNLQMKNTKRQVEKIST